MTADDSTLTLSRWIAAPPARVWAAWANPAHLAQWWIPAPLECRVVKLDLRPGGGFETLMREGDGPFQPHVEGCFLEIAPGERMVWTTCLAEGWRPLEPWLALTATLTLAAEGAGTRYVASVQHRNAEDSAKHADLGFEAGWGMVIDQLAAFPAAQKAP